MFRDKFDRSLQNEVARQARPVDAARPLKDVRSPPLAPAGWDADPAGALILGGDHGSLGVARSLGRRGIPVWFITDDNIIARFSRYTTCSLVWPGPNDPLAADFLLALAKERHLDGWVLFPAGDREVKLIGQNLDVLSPVFRTITPHWDVARIAVDKHRMYRHAAALGLAHPQSYEPRSRNDVLALDCQFPLILKPSAKRDINTLTQAKAWRIDNRDELIGKYDAAAKLVGADCIVLQELIPGGGETQFSYTGVWHNGAPVVSMIARRTRQYPTDFGTGTYVESVDNPEVERAAETFLASLNYSGMVEIEFKFDARDSRYKILDVNPRVWTWTSLGALAGVDFALAQWQLVMGENVPAARGRAGVAWMYFSKDILAAFAEMAAGRLSPRGYLKSFFRPLTFAACSTDDPRPALADLPLAIGRFWRQRS